MGSVAIGGGETVCALTTTHKLYCWGNNGNGQAGTQMFSETPVAVTWP